MDDAPETHESDAEETAPIEPPFEPSPEGAPDADADMDADAGTDGGIEFETVDAPVLEVPDSQAPESDLPAEPESEPDAAVPEPAAEPPSLDEMVARLSEPASTEAGAAADLSEEPADAGHAPGQPEPRLEDVEEFEVPVTPPLMRHRMGTRLPFWVYGAAWAGFVGYMTYLLWPASLEPFVASPDYANFVMGGVALLAGGFVLGLVVWIFARIGTTKLERAGLMRAVAFRTAGWMAAGVTMWWIALYALDLHRAGVIG